MEPMAEQRGKGRKSMYPKLENLQKDESKSKSEADGDSRDKNFVKFEIFGKTVNLNTTIASTHLNIFLYATCFWIQNGTLPYLTDKLGIDMVVYGYLQTTFAVVQLMGGPLFGRFGDLYGGRAAMILAFSSAFLSYFMLGLAGSFFLVFLSRLPSIFMHAMQGGQMIVTDVGNAEQRAGALGMLGLSYGVGMVVGPLVGGLVIKYFSEQSAAFVACFGSLLSIGVAFVSIPQHTKKTSTSGSHETGKASVFDLKKYWSLMQSPGAGFLLLIRTAAGIPIGVFQSMFSMLALKTFHLSAEQNGYMMSYIGILTMIVQGLGVSILTKKFSENTILKGATFSLIFSYFALSQVTTVTQLCVVIAPLVVGLASSNIVISSALTRTCSDLDTGAMLGLNMAVNSLIRTVSPTIGGYMLKNLGFPSFGYLGAVMLTFTSLLLLLKLRN